MAPPTHFYQDMATPTHFYPYGTGVGDTTDTKKHNATSGEIPMSTSFVLYGTSFNDLVVGSFV